MIRISVIIIILVAGISLPFISNSAHAHLVNYSFDELVQKSNFIFVGEVKNTKTSFNGSKTAELQLIKPIKGNINTKIIVKYGQPYNVAKEDLTQLIVGMKYLFYIVENDNKYYLIGIRGNDYYKIDDNNNVYCNNQKIPVDKCIDSIKMVITDIPHK